MPLVRAEIEEPPVQAERAVVVDFEYMVEQLVEIGRAAIGGEPHDLVFALVDLEPEILGEHRVEQPERIREMDRPDFGQAVALAEMHCRGLVLADPVEGDDDGALERRREERRGGVRAVMRAMLDRAEIVQVLLQLRRDRQLVLHEFRDALVEDAARARPVIDHLVPQAVELHCGVFVEDDPVEIVDVELQRVQRGADRPYRKTRVVLDAAQPLLVDRETDRVVIHHRERAVVVVAGNSHYQHVTAPVLSRRYWRRSSQSGGAAAGAPAPPVRGARKSGKAGA